jgi:hypothetical protein
MQSHDPPRSILVTILFALTLGACSGSGDNITPPRTPAPTLDLTTMRASTARSAPQSATRVRPMAECGTGRCLDLNGTNIAQPVCVSGAVAAS